MPVTYQDVYAELSREEPDYRQAAKLGAEAMPHLEAMIRGGDPMMASKAAYLVGLVGGDRAAAVLHESARHQSALVRVATASAVAHLPLESAAAPLEALLGDADLGVRKIALRSVKPGLPDRIRERVRGLAAEGPLRDLSADVLRKIEKP